MNQGGDFAHHLIDVDDVGLDLLEVLLALHQNLVVVVQIHQLLLLLGCVHVFIAVVVVVVDAHQQRLSHLQRQRLVRLKILLNDRVELRHRLLQHQLMTLVGRGELHDGVQLLYVTGRGFDGVAGAFLNDLTATCEG